MLQFKRILVPIDGGELDRAVLDAAASMAQALHGSEVPEVRIVTVIDVTAVVVDEGMPAPAEQMLLAEQETTALVESATSVFPSSVHATAEIRRGVPTHDLVSIASTWPADLVVMGTHGRSGLSRLLVGSVAEHMIRHAPCPLMIVRPPSESTGKD